LSHRFQKQARITFDQRIALAHQGLNGRLQDAAVVHVFGIRNAATHLGNRVIEYSAHHGPGKFSGLLQAVIEHNRRI
jgi:hypothetical protein